VKNRRQNAREHSRLKSTNRRETETFRIEILASIRLPFRSSNPSLPRLACNVAFAIQAVKKNTILGNA